MLFLILFGQMYNHAQTYGHEWIPAGGNCVKVKIAVNGYYRLKPSQLRAGGMEGTEIRSEDLKLINFGRELPLDLTKSSGPLIEDDYIGFYAEKNTIGLDSLLYKDWKKDLFNPEYSHVTDTNAYFICLEPGVNHLRYTEIQQDIAGNSDTPWPYYLHDEKVIFTSNYFKNVDGDVRYSNFEPSEGFGSELRQNSTINLTVSGFLPSAIAPVLSIRGGANNHLQKLQLNLNGQFLDTLVSGAKQNINRSYTLNEQDIKSAMNLNIRNLDPNDRHRIAYVSLQYTRAFQFGGGNSYRFTMDASDSSRKIEISGFNLTGGNIVLYDLNKGLRYNTLISGDKVLAVIGPSDGNTDYLLVNENSGILTVPQISRPEIIMPQYNDEDYIIISNKVLRPEASDYVLEYAAYRSSAEGGSHKVKIVDVQEIYDLFGYGIDRHFYSFKNFSEYIRRYWQEVKFVLILGKGIEYPFARKPEEVEAMLHKTFYIPSYGYPASDNMLFSERDFPDPYFAIGRIAARNAEDIKIYLDKIKEYDAARRLPQTIEDRYWMKKVLHLGGGNTQPEQSAIRNGLNNMENVIEQSLMGAEVSSFYKTSTDVLQSATSAQIKSAINNGLNLITFFGHSGVGTFDFSLENPREYQNQGKYPLINSLGCYSGNIHTPQKGISESFVLEKNKGAIGFLASAGTAFIGALSVYGREFYNNIGNEYYGVSIGEINRIMANKNRFVQFSNLSFYQQLTFHGDPALSLYHFDGPDFVFDFNSIKTNPSLISSSTSEFTLDYEIVNIGKKLADSLDVQFIYQLPSGRNADTIQMKIDPPASRNNYTAKFEGFGVESIGKNIIFGKIDPGIKIEEYPQPGAVFNNIISNNNEAGYVFYILDNTAFPVYPPDYSIEGSKEITLIASTSNAFLPASRYIFELDTTALFNSPAKLTKTIDAEGGLIRWKPSLTPVPNTVYYWRISPDSISPDVGFLWQQSSFLYLPESREGWNHSHYYQYLANNGNKVINMEENRKHTFPPGELFVQMRNGLYLEEVIGYRLNLGIRYTSIRPWLFTSGGAVSFVLQNPDKLSDALPGGITINNGGDFNSIFSGEHATRRNFAFKTDTPENRKKVIDFIQNHIPHGEYVTFFTVMNKDTDNVFANEWESDTELYGTNLLKLLENEGAQSIRYLSDNGTVPYIFMFQKGVRPIVEKVALNPSEVIETQMSIPTKGNSGVLKSIIIGKAAEWDRVTCSLSGIETGDSVSLTVIAIDKSGNEQTIVKNHPSLEYDLSSLDAGTYPSVRLELSISDPTNKTMPIINHLRVYFKPLPDLVIDPASLFVFHKDTIDEGDQFRFKVAMRNISTSAEDSIRVKYTVIDISDNTEQNFYNKYKAVGTGDTIHLSFNLNTKGKSGDYLFIADANDERKITERHFFNNIGKQIFHIQKDRKNPAADIYFDGIRIMDGDIVSPEPEITIHLTDNNPYLPLTNPSLFTIKLDTGRNQIINIPMDDPRIKFTPQNGEISHATIQFNPILKSGDYKLIVQAQDESGNLSGNNDISVNFRVIETQSVSNVLNYPNPFSTSTQFIFTLTGNEIPDIFSISIMTLSGKVVREITKDEIGDLRIGVNRTQFKWDGTDEFGSKLANGVYLYKVNIRKNNGEKYDNFDLEKADSFFKEGFGKMVIMR